jgi:hypothetical protein
MHQVTLVGPEILYNLYKWACLLSFIQLVINMAPLILVEVARPYPYTDQNNFDRMVVSHSDSGLANAYIISSVALYLKSFGP